MNKTGVAMHDAEEVRKQNGLTVAYGRNASGRIARKVERFNGSSNVLEYAYDAAGRLTEVKNNAAVAETYKYSASGQRVRSKVWYEGCPSASTSAMEKSRYSYNGKGQLESDGQNRYAFDKYGSVSSITGRQGLRLAYSGSTMLGKAVLSDGCELRYAYKGTALYRRYRHNDITGEYRWNDQAQLVGFRDHELRLEYDFAYDADGTLTRIVIRPLGKSVLAADAAPADGHNGSDGWLYWFGAENRRERVCQRLAAYQQFYSTTDAGKQERPAQGAATPGSASASGASALSPLVLDCCCDHLGTPRLFVGPDGKVIKEVVRSSFGKIVYDSLPCLYVPIGFCGGLEDRDTHLIRFNWRDYDPRIGRFMSLDPANDTRGDGDLYDYCVDDPINRLDASGLAWDESKHPRDADGQFTTAGDDVSGYSTKGQELRAPVSGWTMFRADVGRNAMLEREELKRSAILRNGMMRREEVWPRDKPLPKWDLDAAIAHLQNAAHRGSIRRCGEYVHKAIDAGGITLNTAYNPTKESASGYGPILRHAGFRTVAPGEKPQKGDVVVFQAIEGHKDGHVAMFDGKQWISDFKQESIYAATDYQKTDAPYVIYRRP